MSTALLALASTSPARQAVLTAAHIRYRQVDASVDETALVRDLIAADAHSANDAPAQVSALARAKARAGLQAARECEASMVLGCDSLFELDGIITGKPQTPARARNQLRAMRGKCGTLHTGHCLIRTDDGTEFTAVGTAQVHITTLTDREIDAYVATQEPLWVAGCFTLEGYGGVFIERIDGSHHNVLGLSLPLLRQLIAQAGGNITDFWLPAPPNAR
ncbi:MAG: Maf family protein [Bowdeniella nasicola]|nr:Maf family protein [Bowdeniella nasicola]